MKERFEIVEKAIITMLEDKKYATLRDILVTMNPADIAAVFADMEETRLPLLFRLLPKEAAADIADKLVRGGVKGIWNFANMELDLSDKSVIVENIHLGDSLMKLCYEIKSSGEAKND